MTVQPSLLHPEMPLEEIKRKPTLGKALEYCAELAGYGYDKQLEAALNKRGCHVDKTQLSRWQQGSEGIKWEKLSSLMDVCGNDAPLYWMLHNRGFDIHSLRRTESQTERELRLAREENLALRRALMGSLT